MPDPMRREEGPGPTVCPQCHHDKIDWTNYEEWAEEHDRSAKAKL